MGASISTRRMEVTQAMQHHADDPPLPVLQDFGCGTNQLRQLPGGQGTAWESGGVILKPTVDPEADGWIAETTQALEPTRYRVSQPLRTKSDQWTSHGWCAWVQISGEHGSGGHWSDIVVVARALSEDLGSVTRPMFLERRADPWAVGDQVAWGQPYQARHCSLGRLLARCANLRRSEGLIDQIIHGDLYGNVLFAERELPGVIDLSPYWRPAPYALAIAAVDAMAWYSACTDIVDDLDDLKDRPSLLARATMFRLVTADLIATPDRIAQQPLYIEETAREFSPVVELIEKLARAGS